MKSILLSPLLRKLCRLRSDLSLSAVDRDWELAFKDAAFLERAPAELEVSKKRLLKSFNRLYEATQVADRQRRDILLGIIGIVDFCDGVAQPAVELQAVREKALRLLLDLGHVEPWMPELGAPRPEGCRVVKRLPDEVCPRGGVSKVLLPGYKQGVNILRFPEVIISEGPPTKSTTIAAPPSDSQNVVTPSVNKRGGETGIEHPAPNDQR